MTSSEDQLTREISRWALGSWSTIGCVEPMSTCRAKTRQHNEDGCFKTATGYSHLFYMFGRGQATKKVYWSTYDPNDKSGYAQSFWTPVPGLDNLTDIVGAVPYDMGDDQRFLFLFVLVRDHGQNKLMISKYDLEQPYWEQEPTELDVPEHTKKAVVVQRKFESDYIDFR